MNEMHEMHDGNNLRATDEECAINGTNGMTGVNAMKAMQNMNEVDERKKPNDTNEK